MNITYAEGFLGRPITVSSSHRASVRKRCIARAEMPTVFRQWFSAYAPLPSLHQIAP